MVFCFFICIYIQIHTPTYVLFEFRFVVCFSCFSHCHTLLSLLFYFRYHIFCCCPLLLMISFYRIVTIIIFVVVVPCIKCATCRAFDTVVECVGADTWCVQFGTFFHFQLIFTVIQFIWIDVCVCVCVSASNASHIILIRCVSNLAYMGF